MNPERVSSINKVVGGTPDQQKEVAKKVEEEFSKEKWYENFEREKTSEEKEIIEAIVLKLNEFLSQYGAKPLDLKETHIHILNKSKMSDDEIKFFEENYRGTSAFYEQNEQDVTVFDWTIKSPLHFADVVVHELIHFLAFNTVQVAEGYKNNFASHRTGLSVQQKTIPTQKNKLYFHDIDEAVTEELVKRFYPQLQSISLLENEYKNVTRAREKYSNPDVSSVRIKEIEVEQVPSLEITMKDFAYPETRKKFNNLTKTIYEKRKNDFSSEEDVFKIFAKAAMTGEVKELATLVESTLGAGTFKKIAQSLDEFGQENTL